MYIYIYRERERDTHIPVYIYIYIYTHTYTSRVRAVGCRKNDADAPFAPCAEGSSTQRGIPYTGKSLLQGNLL